MLLWRALSPIWSASSANASPSLRPGAACGKPAPEPTKPPRWAYLGGLPGAFTVVLAGITVNSRLALPGTVAFMLVGQVAFGIVSDGLGLFGVAKRRITLLDLAAGTTILAGSALIIFGKS